MSFSPRGYASRHAELQTDRFSNIGSKSSSLERSYPPPDNMWSPTRTDLNMDRASGAFRNRFQSDSPTKSRRSSRRLSGEDFGCMEWVPGVEELRPYRTRENERNHCVSEFAQNNPRANYNPNHTSRFSSGCAPDGTHPAGFNSPLYNEPLLGSNSQRWGVTDQDHYKKRSKSHDSRRSRNHPNHHTWSPNVSSKHRSSRSEKRHSLSSIAKPKEAVSLKKWIPIEDEFKDEAFTQLQEEFQRFVKKKKKKKKKNKDRRKSRSRSEEKCRNSPENIQMQKQSPRRDNARRFSPLKANRVDSTGCSTPSAGKALRGITRERDSLDSDTLESPLSSFSESKSNKSPHNLARQEATDSYVCAIVKKRRISSQENEGNAILKFTRVEGRSRNPGSPKQKSGLAGSIKRNQDSTPTSAKKTARTGQCGAVTPSTESQPADKQTAALRSSPSKGDIKPKALIKPGLRSERKEPTSAHESKLRGKTPLKKENDDKSRRLVQRTLESYFCKSASKSEVRQVQVESTGLACSAEISKSADQGNSSKNHVRRIYCDEAEPASQPVVQLTPISEGLISKLQSPKASADSVPRGRWGGAARLAEVRPTLSPAKKRSCESPPPAEPIKGEACRRLTRTASLESAAPEQQTDAMQPEEDLAQNERDEAAREDDLKKAAQRNRKRHTRGNKVFAFCDVLQENIERHPVQNEIPANKWHKWLNPAQMRCLVSAMLVNTDLCLHFSLEAERNEEWEEYWVKLAQRLNTVCFNELTNLNTGLRMTVSEWKTCWLDFKKVVKTRVDAMTPKERLHNLGSLDCLLYSKNLYTALMESNGECLGDECPKIWCPGACVGVFCPSEPARIRSTEE